MLLYQQKDAMVHILICAAVVTAVFYALNKRSPRGKPSPPNLIEPPIVPSWLPLFGSVLDYLFHPLSFLRTYSTQYGSSFKFKILGRKIIAISSPAAVSSLLGDHSGAFEVANGQHIHRLAGLEVDKDRIPHVYSALMRRGGGPVHRALMPSRLSTISSRFTQDLLKGLKQFGSSTPPTSLSDFVHRTLYNASSTALFGPDFPLHTYENFMTFDYGSPLILRGLSVFARAAVTARESTFACWTRYFTEHWVPGENGYLDGAADMVSDIYRGLKQADLTQDEVHRLMGIITWTVHSNVLVLAHWVMCHITTDKDTYARACQEIRSFADEKFPQIDDIVRLDPKVLEGDDFRFLNSVVQEVMRTKLALGPTRMATRDTVIRDENGKAILVRKGELVTVNFQGMHFSQDLQGDPEVFKADRFVDGGAPYRSYAFGSGKHICAGRNYANFVVRQFVILTLAMYDIRVEPDKTSGYGSLPERDGGFGVNFMAFFRPQHDLSIILHKRSP